MKETRRGTLVDKETSTSLDGVGLDDDEKNEEREKTTDEAAMPVKIVTVGVSCLIS